MAKKGCSVRDCQEEKPIRVCGSRSSREDMACTQKGETGGEVCGNGGSVCWICRDKESPLSDSKGNYIELAIAKGEG